MANLNFIKKVLPMLGTVLSVAMPGPIGIAASILTKTLGSKEPIKADAGSIATALETALSDPATTLHAQEAERQFQLAMNQMNISSKEELEQIGAQDRASARQREEVVKDSTPRRLAYLTVTTGLLMSLFLVSPWFHGSKDAGVAGFAGTVLGYVIGEVKQVMTYYFGSSAGSDRKTEILAAQGNGQ